MAARLQTFTVMKQVISRGLWGGASLRQWKVPGSWEPQSNRGFGLKLLPQRQRGDAFERRIYSLCYKTLRHKYHKEESVGLKNARQFVSSCSGLGGPPPLSAGEV